MSNEHFISTGIAGQVLTLKYQPVLPLAAVRYCDANNRWQTLAPTAYTEDGGRNITLIAAVTRAANVLATQATAGAATTITKAAAGWVVNAYRGKWIVLTGGTGAGQTRRIVSNDATSITVSTAWDTNPDATTTFEVLESDGSGPFNIRVAYAATDGPLINNNPALDGTAIHSIKLKKENENRITWTGKSNNAAKLHIFTVDYSPDGITWYSEYTSAVAEVSCGGTLSASYRFWRISSDAVAGAHTLDLILAANKD